MSKLVVGDVELNIIKLAGWKREAVYNGPHYLYTRNTLGVRATVGAASDPYILNANKAPRRMGPNNPQMWPTTDEAIRHYLMQPRQKTQYLVYPWNANDPIPVLDAPVGDELTDATGGPKPLRCDVVNFYGPRTYLVDYVVQTDINECGPLAAAARKGKPPTILSHIWDTEDLMDQDFYTVRVTKGRIVFNQAGLFALGAVPGNNGQFLPDDFRHALFHPVPLGMKREQVHVVQRSDGVTLDYQITDRERSLQIPLANVTRIEALHQLHYGFGGIVGAAAVAFSEIGRHVKAARAAAAAQAKAVAGEALSEAEKAALAAAETGFAGFLKGAGKVAMEILAADILPQLVHTLEVRVWGSVAASRMRLEQVAKELILKRIGLMFAKWGFLLGCGFDITHDLAGTFVQAKYQLLGSPLTTLLNVAFLDHTTNFGNIANSVFGNSDETGDILVRSRDKPNALPAAGSQNWRGDRGTLLESMVGNYLWSGCGNIQPDPMSSPRWNTPAVQATEGAGYGGPPLPIPRVRFGR
jgi:hypothetical protein